MSEEVLGRVLQNFIGLLLRRGRQGRGYRHAVREEQIIENFFISLESAFSSLSAFSRAYFCSAFRRSHATLTVGVWVMKRTEGSDWNVNGSKNSAASRNGGRKIIRWRFKIGWGGLIEFRLIFRHF